MKCLQEKENIDSWHFP